MQLPTFETTETGRGTGLTCPRKECGGKFLLNLDRLRTVKQEAGIVTAPCPFCAKVSNLP